MNKRALVWGLWVWGAVVILGTQVYGGNWVQFDDHDRSTIRHIFQKFINRITVNDTDGLTADDIMDIFKDIKSSLLQYSSINTSRVNWFMQCVNNCLHTYDDNPPHTADATRDRPPTPDSPRYDDLSLLGVTGNVTVELLFKCNHVCATNPGSDLIGR